MGFGDPPASVPIAPHTGVVVYVSPASAGATGNAADALVAALRAEGISIERVNAAFGDASRRPAMIEIVIGVKPR